MAVSGFLVLLLRDFLLLPQLSPPCLHLLPLHTSEDLVCQRHAKNSYRSVWGRASETHGPGSQRLCHPPLESKAAKLETKSHEVGEDFRPCLSFFLFLLALPLFFYHSLNLSVSLSVSLTSSRLSSMRANRETNRRLHNGEFLICRKRRKHMDEDSMSSFSGQLHGVGPEDVAGSFFLLSCIFFYRDLNRSAQRCVSTPYFRYVDRRHPVMTDPAASRPSPWLGVRLRAMLCRVVG